MAEPEFAGIQSYDLNHEPIGMLEGAMLLGDQEQRQIGNDTIEGTRVSTVFLVIDHSHGHGPVPILYETMVFREDGEDSWCDRYATRDAALAGHDRACAWVRAPEIAPAPLRAVVLNPH